MNGIEKITARIETDVKAEVEAILKDAETRAAALRAEYEAKAKKEAAVVAEEGREAAARPASAAAAASAFALAI